MEHIKLATMLERAIGRIGIELMKKQARRYWFKYQHLNMVLAVDEKQMSYSFILNISEFGNSINETMVLRAMDALGELHKSYSAHWRGDIVSFTSPHYYLVSDTELDCLTKQLSDFFDAFAFFQACLLLLGDSSILEMMSQPGLTGQLINKTSLL